MDQLVLVPITLSDVWPGLQGHNIFRSQISEKWCVSGTKLLYHSNRKPYLTEWYHVWWPWLTSKCIGQFRQHQLSFLSLHCIVRDDVCQWQSQETCCAALCERDSECSWRKSGWSLDTNLPIVVDKAWHRTTWTNAVLSSCSGSTVYTSCFDNSRVLSSSTKLSWY